MGDCSWDQPYNPYGGTALVSPGPMKHYCGLWIFDQVLSINGLQSSKNRIPLHHASKL